MKTIFATLMVLLLLAVLGGLAFIYSGLYNVAASEPHSRLGNWIFDTAMKRSVHRRAEGVTPPPRRRMERITEGFKKYDEMCVTCHGAPGVERSEIGKGLTPPAPDLAKEAEHWTPTQLFWIIKHGIKMTGMPAWGKSHDDDALWDLVAFVERLPSLSPQDYRALRRAHAGGGGNGDHRGGGH